MPSRMIHYLIAEKVAEQVSINDIYRFKLGSICPDMSTHDDDSKNVTHFMEHFGNMKGANWNRFLAKYRNEIMNDDLYIGILCHLITDMVWFHDIMHTQIRVKSSSEEERIGKYIKGYDDFHRLNYILKNDFGLTYDMKEDRNIVLEGIHLDLYEDVFEGLYKDFFEEPEAHKEELITYTYDITLDCILLCIRECVSAVKAIRSGEEVISPGKYFVPVLD